MELLRYSSIGLHYRMTWTTRAALPDGPARARHAGAATSCLLESRGGGKLLLASVLHEAYAAVAAGWPAICQSRGTLWNGTALAILKQHSRIHPQTTTLIFVNYADLHE